MSMTTGGVASDPPASVASGSGAYPHDLAVVVRERWSSAHVEPGATSLPLPDPAVLERALSVCYQASLLREEGRSTTFRLAVSGPEAFASAGGPPASLHRLLFTEGRPFDAHELRRLAPAAAFQSSIIGAQPDERGGLWLWGMIHSGPRWLQSVRGGREIRQVIPAILMIAVTGPGRVLVSRGTATIAELIDGAIGGPGMDLLQAPWMSDAFVRAHDAAPLVPVVEGRPAQVDPAFRSLLTGHVLRRILATIREAQHGGTLILLPSHDAAALLAANRHLSLKYTFEDEEPRRRIVTLTTQIVDALARLHRDRDDESVVRWTEYEVSLAPELAALDEALFEVAHLVASLADVDGAVVMTTRLELIGFGGEIAGHLPEVPQVVHALDLDATRHEWVRTDRVGTRHRSAYRFCQAMPDAVVVVVSRDGGMRFVRRHNGAVTYWDQIATGPWEV
jgi:hypothetical protein